MEERDIEIFCPPSRMAWRRWLAANHDSKQAVWVIFYKKISGKPMIPWGDAVEEALCFGWVDSKRRPIDGEKFMQFFSRRKTGSGWSKINKAKVEELIGKGLMTAAGYASIEAAKQNNSWTMLDDVEALKIPKDLEKAFKSWRGSKKHFLGLSKSVRKMLLQWIAFAKRPETRQKRILEVARLSGDGLLPKQFAR